MDYIALIIGGLLGAVVAWLLMRGKVTVAAQQASSTAQELAQSRWGMQQLQGEITTLTAAKARLEATLEQEQKQAAEKLQILSQAREELTHQFKSLAAEILDEKSKKFTEVNQTNLDQLLSPIKTKLDEFKKKVEDCYDTEGKQRSALAEQVRMLSELNKSISQEAQNLTLALKGDRKAVGNWGEIILEDVLERAGLVKGQHYDVQDAVKTDDGQAWVIPDVVIRLPGERNIVVDSKVTVPDYRAYVAADDEKAREEALKRHLTCIRAHMKGLSEKKYQTLYGLKSLDFVVMFVPLEPAFMLAVTHDRELFHDAWEKNVLIVSPSTLLFVIRTVAALWRQEDLSRNAQEISKRGGELYDKLVGFVTDLQAVGVKIDQAKDCYESARKKLAEGRGNVIRQAEMLKELGVKPSKSLPADWVEGAVEELIPALTHKRDRQLPPAEVIEGDRIEQV